jgi:hypothetical protein
MKTTCPVCGKAGFLEKRSSCVRFKHYVGFRGGKRVYETHTVNIDSQVLRESMHGSGAYVEKNNPILSRNRKTEGFVEPSAGFGPATITLPR